MDSLDEEKEDELVQKITTEARSIPCNKKHYDLSDFTHAKAREQTSPALLRLVSKLVSNGKVTKRSLSLSQSLQFCMNNTRN